VSTDAAPWFEAPSLRTEETRTASRLELFFDLAFVLAIAEVAAVLKKHLDLPGTVEFAGLFTLIWLAWAQCTLYANRFDTDDIVYRCAKFASMAAVLGSAASMSGALDTHATAFAVSYLAGRVVLASLYGRAWWHVKEARPTLQVYLGASVLIAGLWAGSLAVPTPARFGVWAFAALVDLAAPVLASRSGGHAPLHLEHLPERFALLVILVLGEVIAATVTGVRQAAWAPDSVVVAGAGFVVAAALWWTYFDVGAVVSTNALQEADDESRESAESEEMSTDERHDLFVYAHLPVTAGIVATGVGIEELITHPSADLPTSASWCAVLGLVAFLLGSVVVQGGTRRRFGRALVWPGSVVPVLLLLGWLSPSSVLAFTVVLALALTLTAAAGTVLLRRTPR
jgi:low temperature requirement protein LtrA